MKKHQNTKRIPLYNSRIFNNYLKLIKKNYPHIKISELLESAKMKSYEVADEGHWFTQDQVNLFHEKLSRLTNNENIAREAGRFAASVCATVRAAPLTDVVPIPRTPFT